jgi:hypothetical protein
MKSFKIISFLCLILGIVLMAGAGLSMIDTGIHLPGFLFGSSGSVIAVMSFASVTMPTDTGFEDGEENMGGNGVIAYIALFSDISVWPAELTTPTTLEQMVALSGNFTMKSQKYFIRVTVPPDSLSDDNDTQGEPGGQSFKNKGVFKIPGKDGTNRGLARRLKNSMGIIIIPNEENYRICYGTEFHPVRFSIGGKSGLKAADYKGFEYNWECDSNAPGHTYNGSIPLSGAITLPAIS